jgi:hypothetical protein
VWGGTQMIFRSRKASILLCESWQRRAHRAARRDFRLHRKRLAAAAVRHRVPGSESVPLRISTDLSGSDIALTIPNFLWQHAAGFSGRRRHKIGT